jgi:hypothetical protein
MVIAMELCTRVTERVDLARIRRPLWFHYVKTSNRLHNICNGPLTPVTCTHICNGCCLAPVTHKCGWPTPGLVSAMPITNVDF